MAIVAVSPCVNAVGEAPAVVSSTPLMYQHSSIEGLSGMFQFTIYFNLRNLA